ncbi:MAG: urease accessory protein UreF [Zoogloeaceae bacterium]|jgi:urease accessory protein|nr:urease accessory protein UreF [Zoogloeaceae bacterium]
MKQAPSALLSLLHLASPALPVGAFSYSQGLEWAVDAGVAGDVAGVARWIGDALRFSVGTLEAPAVAAFFAAWQQGDGEAAEALNQRFLAMRDSAESRAETLQMGRSLLRLLRDLDLPAWALPANDAVYPNAWAAAAAHWGVAAGEAVAAYVWAWLENQVMAAVKLVPLGQTDGQRLLLRLAPEIPAIVATALASAPEDWQNFTPALAIASSRHETQYSRLFRS